MRNSWWIDARDGEARRTCWLVCLVPRWVSLAAPDIHRCVLQHVHTAACSQGDRPPAAVSLPSTAPLLDGDIEHVDGAEGTSFETKLIPCHLLSCPRLPLPTGTGQIASSCCYLAAPPSPSSCHDGYGEAGEHHAMEIFRSGLCATDRQARRPVSGCAGM